jgi:hypothetical protein
MTFKTPVAFSLAFLLLGQSNSFAASAPLELKWNELNTAIYQKTVELTLPNAVTIKGDVAAVREDGLVLDIKKTSDSKAFPKGNGVIPRTSVTLLQLEKRGTNWRTMGTVIGAIAGVALGGYIAAKTANSEGPAIAIFIATASATSIAGRAAGGAADRSVTMIRVVP